MLCLNEDLQWILHNKTSAIWHPIWLPFIPTENCSKSLLHLFSYVQPVLVHATHFCLCSMFALVGHHRRDFVRTCSRSGSPWMMLLLIVKVLWSFEAVVPKLFRRCTPFYIPNPPTPPHPPHTKNIQKMLTMCPHIRMKLKPTKF